MTDISQDGSAIFATPASAAAWLKGALQSWERTGKTRAYAPFESQFKPNRTPHEILDWVYRSLEADGEDTVLLQANFRAGAALLIGEPELVEWHPMSALELIRLGGRLGSVEILEAATQLLRVANFASALAAAGDRSALLATEIYHNIVTAQFSGPRFLDFLEACKRHTQNEDIDPTHLLVTLARNDRENWAKHAISLTGPLHAFYLRRVGSEDFAEVLDFFMDDLLAALDRHSLDFYRIFVAGWVLIAGSSLRDKLLFLYNWPPLPALLSEASATGHRVRRSWGMSPDAKRPANTYANYFESFRQLVYG